MIVYFTARAKYNKNFDASGLSWSKYIEWSRLSQLIELISVDGMLNENLVEPDRNNAAEWNYIVTDNQYETGFFSSLSYVLSKVADVKIFNLLAVVIEPEQKCEIVPMVNFEFVGYDLVDKDYSVSALSNCGGFDETFLPTALNKFGLLNDYDKAYDVRKRLVENNPDEHHADTNVIAIWRHLIIGQVI